MINRKIFLVGGGGSLMASALVQACLANGAGDVQVIRCDSAPSAGIDDFVISHPPSMESMLDKVSHYLDYPPEKRLPKESPFYGKEPKRNRRKMRTQR